MSDPYATLGVKSSSSDDEIKQAYRKLAMKHHPDRNDGDEAKFKEIQEAYNSIKDGSAANKPGFDFGKGGFDFGAGGFGNNSSFEDMLREARYRHQMQVSITAAVPLMDAITGADQYMQIPVHGRVRMAKVQIPVGLMHGETIKYPKLVDNVDVIIKFVITPDRVWEVDDLNLIRHQSISIWDLILGSELTVNHPDGSAFRLKIPAMTQPGTRMRVKGKGILSRLNNVTQGDMLIQLDATLPSDIPDSLLSEIRAANS